VACGAADATGTASAAITCRTGNEAVEARISVPAAKATVRGSDLPAVSACISIGCVEDPLRYRMQEALQLKGEGTDLEVVGMSATVGHIHHIPMVVRGWRVGVIALGRCANIGPASCSGVKFARDGSKLRLHGWCQLPPCRR
jgi:hypothetical protein